MSGALPPPDLPSGPSRGSARAAPRHGGATPGLKLTLLGTGTPIVDPRRRGPSQVIEVGNELVLVDAGSGVLYRLVEAGYQQPALRRILFTHLHSDHITGLADLLWAGWITGWWQEPPPIAGPPGTAAFVSSLVQAFAYDIAVRERADRYHRPWQTPRVEEIEENCRAGGDGWQVSGFRVEHEPVDQAFGFRLDAAAGSVVISGDTRPSENLIRHAQDADLLVHEVYWRRGAEQRLAAIDDSEARFRAQSVNDYHTDSDAVGRIAARAGAKHLILSHILFRGGVPEDLRADITPNFAGALTIGEDLRAFELG